MPCSWRLIRPIFILTLILLGVQTAYAQTNYTWTNLGSDWGTGSNWSPSSAPNHILDAFAIFPTPDSFDPNLNAGSFSVRGISFDNTSTGYALSGSTGVLSIGDLGITWTGGNTTAITSNVRLLANQTWAMGSTAVTVNTGTLSGSYQLTKTGAGTLTLDSITNTFAGSLNVQSGAVVAGGGGGSSNMVLRSVPVNLAAGTSLTSAGATPAMKIGQLTGSGSLNIGSSILSVYSSSSATSIFSGTVATGVFNLNGRGNQQLTGDTTAISGAISVQNQATLTLSGGGNATSGVLGAVQLCASWRFVHHG
ncbi:MAG: autotransporter-associated beta strand repeat-containing protein [Gemmatales bacterium]